MKMHNGHGNAACTRTCSITWTCSMDLDLQYGRGHAAWTWTRSVDLDMKHGLGHAAWTWTCSMDMDMLHGNRHAEGTQACNIFLTLQYGHCSRHDFTYIRGWMQMVTGTKWFIFLKQEYSKAQFLMGIHSVHYVTHLYNARDTHSVHNYLLKLWWSRLLCFWSSCYVFPPPLSGSNWCSLPPPLGDWGPLPPRWHHFSQDPRTLPPHGSEQTWTISMEMDTRYGLGHAAWKWTFSKSMDMDMQHELGHAAQTWS